MLYFYNVKVGACTLYRAIPYAKVPKNIAFSENDDEIEKKKSIFVLRNKTCYKIHLFCRLQMISMKQTKKLASGKRVENPSTLWGYRRR